MSTRSQPAQYATRAEYRWARKLWLRRHGGLLIGTVVIAVVFGVVSGSALVLVSLLLSAFLGTAFARSRP